MSEIDRERCRRSGGIAKAWRRSTPGRCAAWLVVAVSAVGWQAGAVETVTVDWNTSLGNTKALVALNGWSAMDQSVATNSSYKTVLTEMKPQIFRLHAAESLRTDEHSKSWLNNNGTWNATKIDAIIDGVKGAANGSLMITINKWPSTIYSGSGKLPADKHDAFADWCGDLVDIVRNDLGETKVVWFEVLNEMDGVYNGASDEMATLVKKCSAEMRSRNSGIKIAAGAWTQPFDDADIKEFLGNVTSTDIQAFTYHHYGSSSSTTDLKTLYDKAEAIGSRTWTIRNWMDQLNLGGVALILGETHMFTTWNLDTNGLMKSHQGAVFLSLVYWRAMNQRINGVIAADSIMPWNDADNTYGIFANNSGTYSRRPPGIALKWLRERFTTGTCRSVTTTLSTLRATAVRTSDRRNLMVINRDPAVTATVNLDTSGWVPTDKTYAEVTISGSGYSNVNKTWGSTPPQNISMPPNSIKFFFFKN